MVAADADAKDAGWEADPEGGIGDVVDILCLVAIDEDNDEMESWQWSRKVKVEI